MTRCWGRVGWQLGLVSYCCLIGAFAIEVAHAQLIPDRTLGNEPSVVTPNVLIRGSRGDRIEGGAQRGVNLFHSFQDLNVAELQRVYFANPVGIENILTRVTGTNPSHILGTLGVDGVANLFLLNPNGILFGQNARLDIAGSFVASTADRLVFGQGLEFSAVNPQAAPLLTINLRPGLQYGSNPGTITNTGNLTVGQDLTLAGGNLLLQGSLQAGQNLTLQATDTVQVRDSVTTPFTASAGGQLLIQGDRGIDLYALNHPNSGLFARGDIVLRSANPINGDAHYTTGGSFRVEQLNGSPGDWGSGDDPIIRASGDVSFTSYTGGSLHILAGGSVTAGTITINGTAPATSSLQETVTLSDGTTLAIDGSTQPTLDIRAGTTAFNSPIGLTGLPSPMGLTLAGTPSSADITVGTITITQPNGLVYLSNRHQPNSALNSPNGIQISDITVASDMQGGAVVIDSRSTITGTGLVDTSAFDDAGNVTMLAAGNINLTATAGGTAIQAIGALGGRITLQSDADLTITGAGDRQNFAVWSISTSDSTTAKGGDVSVTARNLTLRNAGTLLAATAGTAQGGDLNLTADTISIDNSEADTAVFPGASGNGGKITVNTRSLTQNNGSILAVNLGLGNTGDVTVNADSVVLENLAGTLNTTSQMGTLVLAGGVGNAGNLTLFTRSLSARNASQLVATTLGQGNAGNITLVASELIRFDGAIVDEATVDRLVDTVPTGAVSTVQPDAIGQGGNIWIQTPSLTLTNGAQIRTATLGIGNAGNVAIAADVLVLDGVARSTERPSGITSAALSTAVGNGGAITIQAGTVSLTNQAAISATTETRTGSRGATVSGRGGDISLDVDSLVLSGGGQLRSNTSGQGDAGNLSIRAANKIVVQDKNSGLFASTANRSSGNGGRITIATPNQLFLRDRAEISVDSDGSGIGGDIQIQAGSLTVDRNARISAETASNTGGNIALQVPGILLMRRQSQISTTAGTIGAGGNGGNIQIQAGFIVAADLENSDITANAFLGNGGRVEIATQGIFGIQFRPRLTPLSDITASSEFGVAGIVSITTPNLDPTQGLADLPDNPVDASQLVTQSCAPGGSNLATKQGEFIITGRGGLPSAPGDILNPISTWQDFRPLPPTVAQRSPHQQTSPSQPDAIVEAQGWITQPDGQIVLIASTATGFPPTVWSPGDCPAFSEPEHHP
ncbi:filamentous hemagglutinin N-terminal domain-containing protein [Pantanalinema rosaneae CENA516]|uniref:two-partner secretion domain-containing protein n=1 Tax=Pantanalinema rosaneae TaxID=1620701 RepID=UPI003D6EEE6D